MMTAFNFRKAAVTNAYSRLGHLHSVVRAGMTNLMAYSDAGLPLSESYSGGTLHGLAITNGYQ